MKTEIEKRNKPNKNGSELIVALCTRLTDKGKTCHDYQILAILREMSNGELNQLIGLGNVIEWHNEWLITHGGNP